MRSGVRRVDACGRAQGHLCAAGALNLHQQVDVFPQPEAERGNQFARLQCHQAAHAKQQPIPGQVR